MNYFYNTIRLNQIEPEVNNASLSGVTNEISIFLNELTDLKIKLNNTFRVQLKQNNLIISNRLSKKNSNKNNDILKSIQFSQQRLLNEINSCLDSIHKQEISFRNRYQQAKYMAQFNAIRNDLNIQLFIIKKRVSDIEKDVLNENSFLRSILNKINSSIMSKQDLYKEAMAFYDRAIEADSQNYEALIGKGNCYSKLKQYAEAIQCFDRSIQINPMNSKAFYNKGNIYHTQKDYAQALDFYSKAIQLNPSLSEAHNNIGNIYFEQGNLLAAIQAYEKAIEMDALNSKAHKNMGLVMEELNEPRKAIKCYDNAIRLDSNDPDLFTYKATLLMKLGKEKKAAQCFERAIELRPSLAQAHFNKKPTRKKCSSNFFCNIL